MRELKAINDILTDKLTTMEQAAFYIYSCQHGQQYLSNGMALWTVEGIHLTRDADAVADVQRNDRRGNYVG